MLRFAFALILTLWIPRGFAQEAPGAPSPEAFASQAAPEPGAAGAASGRLDAPDERAALLAEIRARRARERQARSAAALAADAQPSQLGRWSYPIGGHLAGSISLMVVGLALGGTGLTLATSYHPYLLPYSSLAPLDAAIPAALIGGGLACSVAGLVWLVGALSGRRRLPPDGPELSVGASAGSAWVGLSGRF